MKIQVNISIDASGKKPKELMKQIGDITSVFSLGDKCGACGGTDVAPAVRQAKGYEFYEFNCLNQKCRARLSLGQTKEGGTLFPKRKDRDGDWLPNGGWVKFQKQEARFDSDKGDSYEGEDDIPL